MKTHNFRLSAVVVLVMLLAMGCAPVSYIGNSYEPTDNVDLYFSVDDIKDGVYSHWSCARRGWMAEEPQKNKRSFD